MNSVASFVNILLNIHGTRVKMIDFLSTHRQVVLTELIFQTYRGAAD